MGYNIYSCAIDLNKLQNSFNSNSNELLEEILNLGGFECYLDGLLDEDIKVSEAIKHILFGEDYIANSEHVYGYALIAICKYWGEKLPYGEKITQGYDSDMVRFYVKTDFDIDFSIAKSLFQNKLNLGLPEVKDFPLIGVLHKADLEALSDRLSLMDVDKATIDELSESPDEDDVDRAFVYDFMMKEKADIKFCLDNKLSLITFLH